MIKLLQSMEWSRLVWDQSCEEIIPIDLILPKIGSVYRVSVDQSEDVLNKSVANILWKPPHSELNTWSDDRPWEILDSYVITGDITSKEEKGKYLFRVSNVELFTGCILSGSFTNNATLPVQGKTDGSVESVFNDSFRTEVFFLDDIIYLCCSVPESFYELIFTNENGRLVALYSAALPYAGYYAHVSKYKLSDSEDEYFRKAIQGASVIENHRDLALKNGHVKGVSWMQGIPSASNCGERQAIEVAQWIWPPNYKQLPLRMTTYAKPGIRLVEPNPAEKWNESPYLKGWRLGFSLVYFSKIFENDAKYTRLNKALAI